MTDSRREPNEPSPGAAPLSYSLDQLTWMEVAQALSVDSRLLLPVGALDQHGPHLPLGTNTYVAERLALDLSRATGILLAPTLKYGVPTPSRGSFAGVAGLRRKSLHRMVNELLAAWEDHGVTEFIFITAHRYEPHLDALLMAFTASAKATVINLYTIDVEDLLDAPPEGERGGELETSLLLHLAPERVRTEQIADLIPDVRTYRRYVRGRVPTPPPETGGAIGRPTTATAEKGKAVYGRYLQTLLRTFGDAEGSPGTDSDGRGV